MSTAITNVETGVTANTQSTNPALAYLATLSTGASRNGMRSSLNIVARIALGEDPSIGAVDDFMRLDWTALQVEHYALLRSEIVKHTTSPASAAKHISAVRGVVDKVWELSLAPGFDAEVKERALRALRVKGLAKGEDADVAPGRHITDGEIGALVEACRRDSNIQAGTRDAAIIGLMVAVAGLRRTEVVTLSLDDFNQADRTLLVHGKGGKRRVAYLENGAGETLMDWLHLRGDEPGALFCPVNKGGRITVNRMSSQAVYNMLKKRAQQAGISDFSPHDLRRTFVGNLLSSGEDISTVQKMVGHSNPSTTARYDQRPAEQKRRAVGKLHFGWNRRFRDGM